MFGPDDRVLVAVSGGKDSLALWDVLLDLGYDVTGLYLGLGIGEYSDRSHEHRRGFADGRAVPSCGWSTWPTTTGTTSPPPGARVRARHARSAGCRSARVQRAALEGGFDVIATGHNLDDEAATLLGNTLRWNTEYIARQSPVLLPGKDGMREEGEAPASPVRARDGRLRVPARHRVRGRGVPARRREHPAPVQGGDERDRGQRRRAPRRSSSSATSTVACRLFRTETTRSSSRAGRAGSPPPGRFCAFCRARAQVLGRRLGRPAPEADDREVAAELVRRGAPRRDLRRARRSDERAVRGRASGSSSSTSATAPTCSSFQTGATFHTHSGHARRTTTLIGAAEGTRVDDLAAAWSSWRSGRGSPTTC